MPQPSPLPPAPSPGWLNDSEGASLWLHGGWPERCRWCGRPIRTYLPTATTPMPFAYGCPNCDNPGGHGV